MKRLISILAIATFMLINFNMDAKLYISYYKKGGFFGYYNYVNQTFNGFDGSHNEYYTMVCTDPGTTRCKIGSVRSMPTGTQTMLAYVGSTMDNMITSAETSISSGTLTGTSTVHLSNPWGIYPEVIVKITWTSVDSIGTDYALNFEIYEI